MNAPNSPDELNLDEAQHGDSVDVQGLAFPADGDQVASHTPLPNWLLVVIIGLVGWSGWYLGEFSGGWSSMVYDETATGGAPTTLPPPPEVDLLALGDVTYTRVCSACHQSDGAGQAGLYPPLAGSRWVTGNPEVPIKIVLNGLEGPIEVNGNIYDQVMTPHGSMLDDNQVAGVLTWVRQQWGNDASEVSPDLVAELRVSTEERTTAWTAPELEPLLGDANDEENSEAVEEAAAE